MLFPNKQTMSYKRNKKRKGVKDFMETQIQRQIDNTVNGLAYPTECKITKIYQDNKVDITCKYGKLTYVTTMGLPISTDDYAIVLFLDNDYKKPIVILDNKNNIGD